MKLIHMEKANFSFLWAAFEISVPCGRAAALNHKMSKIHSVDSIFKRNFMT